jgi:hypothetical protein
MHPANLTATQPTFFKYFQATQEVITIYILKIGQKQLNGSSESHYSEHTTPVSHIIFWEQFFSRVIYNCSS